MPSPKSIIQKKMRACEDLAARCANEQPSVTNQPALSIRPLSRRRFIGRIGGAAAAAWTASAISLSPVLGSKSVKAEAATILGRQRAIEAYDLRKDAALAEYHLPIVSHPNNGDEDLLQQQDWELFQGLATQQSWRGGLGRLQQLSRGNSEWSACGFRQHHSRRQH